MRYMITLIIGCCLLSLAVFLAIREHLWLKGASIADGTVIELIASRGSKGGTTYRPRVSYKTRDGREATFTRGYASSPPGFRVGEKVAVAYHPEDEKARILTFGQRFGFALILGIAGGALVFGTIGYKLGNKVVLAIYQGQNIPPVRKSVLEK
jgi:hypothetical protein